MENNRFLTIDLIRHGQPIGGARFRGQCDDPLSEIGWQDMCLALGGQTPWTAIVSSPLARCFEFSSHLAQRNKLAVEIEQRFAEISFGAWEGRARDEVRSTDGENLRSFWMDPENCPPPGGERLVDFQRRVLAGWEELQATHEGGHVLLVAHAGVIRIILMTVLSMKLSAYYRLEIPMAKVSRIKIDDDRGRRMPRLMFHGSTLT